jgi:hypothetical protein
MTTNKRQLGMTFRGILDAAGIDDLALEIRLTEAAVKFFDGVKDPAKVRSDILTGMIGYAQAGQAFADMEERIEKNLHVTPDGSDAWNEVVKWIMKKDATGETIEKYTEWCIANPYASPKTHQIAGKPSLIKITWTAAFVPPPSAVSFEDDPRGVW